MKNHQFEIKTAGLLYLIATTSSITGTMLMPDLSKNTNNGNMGISVLLQLLNDAAVVGIGILLFKGLRLYHETVAISVLSTRIIEAVILATGNIPLLLITSQVADSHSASIDLPNLAQQWSGWSFSMARLALGIGGVILCSSLYKWNAIPRAIAILGISGYLILFAKSVCDFLGYTSSFAFFLPVALFELIFPVWLMVKGLKAKQAVSSDRI